MSEEEVQVFFRGDLDVRDVMEAQGFTLKERVLVDVLLTHAWARMEENATSLGAEDYDHLSYTPGEYDASFEIEADTPEDIVTNMAKWMGMLGPDGVPGVLLDGVSETVTLMSIGAAGLLATCGLRILNDCEDSYELADYADGLSRLNAAMWLLEIAYEDDEGVQLTLDQLLDVARREGRDEMRAEYVSQPHNIMLNGERRVAGVLHSGEHIDKIQIVLLDGENDGSVVRWNDVVEKILDGDLELYPNTEAERDWRLIGMLEALSSFGVVEGNGDAVNVEMRRLNLLAALPDTIIAKMLPPENLR